MNLRKYAMNEITAYGPPEPDDDGYHGSLKGRLLRGTSIKWNDTAHWADRDGLTPPSPLLVIAINEILQKWKDGKAEIINEKPLPDAAQLNGTIPIAEWERGIDNTPRPPWAHVVVVYLVNFTTGEFFTYASATTGGHIAYDALKEAVITMRALRGTRVMPVVNLSERPMKTKFGMKRRPHFEIVGWKTPGDDSNAVPVKPMPPQISGPVIAPVETPPVPAPEASSAAHLRQAKPKTPVNLTTETLAAMGQVKPLTSNEIFDDEISW
jgi:hypothetical protein